MHAKQLLFAFFCCLPAFAHAQSMRCGDTFASTGDNPATVQMTCGAPTAKSSHCKPNTRSNVCELVEEWNYNRGPSEFIQILRFESGKLISVTSGDYGR